MCNKALSTSFTREYKAIWKENLAVYQNSLRQGLKKVPSSGPGQVDFCVGQVTFRTHLPDGQGYEQAARELSWNNKL